MPRLHVARQQLSVPQETILNERSIQSVTVMQLDLTVELKIHGKGESTSIAPKKKPFGSYICMERKYR
jgi:hypothetical protein